MGKKIIDRIGKFVDRRTFLRRSIEISGVFIAGVFGAPKAAYACWGCCQLCHTPGNPVYGDCSCEWSWVCPDWLNTCRWWTCKECYEDCEECDDFEDPVVECRPNICTDVKSSLALQGAPIPGCTPK